MLSKKMVSVLSALTFKPDAEWEVNVLPFGSVYWTDEMPAIGDLFDKPDDMAIIFKVFGMRIKLWDGDALNPEDQYHGEHGVRPYTVTKGSVAHDSRRVRSPWPKCLG